MDLLTDIGNGLKFTALKALDKKIDGREIGRTIDEQLDKDNVLGKESEKAQRGPISNLFFEVLRGMWEEDPQAFRMWLMGKVQELPKPNKEE